VLVERCRRQHADRAGQHRGFVGKDIAEHVAGDDYVELLRILQELHRRIIDIHVRQLDLRVLLAHFDDHFTPQLHGVEHIRLVHRAETPVALLRRLETDMGDAADLALRIAHGIETFALAIGQPADAARLAKVDVAGEFADDQDIQSSHNLRLERGSLHQLGVNQCRAKVGEQLEFLAQAEDRLFRAQLARQRVEAEIADGAEQDGVGFPRQLQRAFRQGMAERAIAGAADRRLFHLELQAIGAKSLQDTHRLGNDFRADTVAREYADFHVGSNCCRQLNSHGCSKRRLASNSRILSTWRRVRPISSRPCTRQCLRNASTSKRSTLPSGRVTVWASRSMRRR